MKSASLASGLIILWSRIDSARARAEIDVSHNAMSQRSPHRSLKIERPLIFIDVQTTGLDIMTSRIVRISTLKIEPDGAERFRTALVNPQAAISPGASEKHGITNEHVEDAPNFDSYARALAQYMEGCDIAGFGINRFHLRVLENEFKNAGVTFDLSSVAVIDAMDIFHKLEPRDFEAAYLKYVGDRCPESGYDSDASVVGDDASGYEAPDQSSESRAASHRDAEGYIRDIRRIIAGELGAAPELPDTPSGLHKWITGAEDVDKIDEGGQFIWSADGDPVINFGKHRGHTLYDLAEEHPDYLEWIAGNDKFTDEQREIARNAAQGIMPGEEE